jgi:hypothetical protein
MAADAFVSVASEVDQHSSDARLGQAATPGVLDDRSERQRSPLVRAPDDTETGDPFYRLCQKLPSMRDR